MISNLMPEECNVSLAYPTDSTVLNYFNRDVFDSVEGTIPAQQTGIITIKPVNDPIRIFTFGVTGLITEKYHHRENNSFNGEESWIDEILFLRHVKDGYIEFAANNTPESSIDITLEVYLGDSEEINRGGIVQLGQSTSTIESYLYTNTDAFEKIKETRDSINLPMDSINLNNYF